MAKDRSVTEKAMDRAEFFRFAYKKAVKASLDMASSVIAPMATLTSTLSEKWATVSLYSPLDPHPRLLFVQGKPVFAWRPEEEAKAFLARCPKDGEMLQWQPFQEVFLCHSCRAQFDKEGKHVGEEEKEKLFLKPLTCRLTDRELAVIIES